MSNRSGPLIASFSGKTVILQVPDIVHQSSNKIASSTSPSSLSTETTDPWRVLYETTIEAVVAASGQRLRPIDPVILDSLANQRLLASPTIQPLSDSSTTASSLVEDPLSEQAVRAVIRQLQKDPKFLNYFVHLSD